MLLICLNSYDEEINKIKIFIKNTEIISIDTLILGLKVIK